MNTTNNIVNWACLREPAASGASYSKCFSHEVCMHAGTAADGTDAVEENLTTETGKSLTDGFLHGGIQ